MTELEKLAVNAVDYDELIVRLEKLAHQQADVKGDSSYDGERMLTHEDTIYWAARAAILTLTARNRELMEALKWTLPLAKMTMESHRIERLRCGHHDMRGVKPNGTVVIGLAQDEIDDIERAESALTAKPDGE